ncbi:MAG: hypothetical protein WAW96_19740 [Alphaproteobacteria bacterium]
MTAAFRASDGPEAFEAALADQGYLLAKGDRRDYVIVDRAGGVHSLARRIDGMKAAELREFMAPMNPEQLPNIEQAREIAAERERRAKEQEAPLDALRIEKAYARGDDYVSQTQAALKDHIQRQEALNDRSELDRFIDVHESKSQARDDHNEIDLEFADRFQEEARQPTQPSEESVEDEHQRREKEVRKIQLADEEARRQSAEQTPTTKSESKNYDNVEMTDSMQARMNRLLDKDDEVDRSLDRGDDGGHDRQREAPGGGRTRSR